MFYFFYKLPCVGFHVCMCPVCMLHRYSNAIWAAAALFCYASVWVAVGIMSLKNAGDGHTVSCSCLLISRSDGFICERLRFLPSQTANPLWPVSAIHSCCFHHMVSCCHIFPCYVLDLSVSVMMTPSSQITL